MISQERIAERSRRTSDPYLEFIEAIPAMMRLAGNAAYTDAHSYRDFLVGASAFAVRPGDATTAIVSAGNLKNKNKTKVCAERKALNLAKKAGFQEVIGLVVAGTTDLELIEDVTNRQTPTLHPCGDCRDLFLDHALMRPATLIVTTGFDTDMYQVHTAEQLAEFYAQPAPGLHAQDTFSTIKHWDVRLATYETLVSAEQTQSAARRRSAAMLAQMALTRSI